MTSSILSRSILFSRPARPTRKVKLLALSTLSSAILCSTIGVDAVQAHARWKLDGPTPPRNASNGLKTAPCGNVTRTNMPATFSPGETIEVEWEETINHPGYFRILFSPQGDQGFDNNVLLDNIPEVPAIKFYKANITLPNITCDACTLQLIQVMTDRPNDPFYYSCADIRLEAAPVNDTTPPSNVSNLTGQAINTSVTLAWTNPAEDFAGTLLIMSQGPVTAIPQTGLTYAVNDTLGADQTVVFSGRQISATLPDLTPSTRYHFKAFAFDDALNYASGMEIEIETPETEVALPTTLDVSLLAEQNTVETTEILSTDGLVIVQANIANLENYSDVTFDWSLSNANLVDTDNEPSTFIFDPSNLAEGTYELQVSVANAQTNESLGRATLILELVSGQSQDVAVVDTDTSQPVITERNTTANEAQSNADTEDTEGGSLGLWAAFWLGLLGVFRQGLKRHIKQKFQLLQ